MTANPTAPTIVLVDGHSLAFRAYYAYAKGRDGGLRTSTGIPTSVCFGFLKSLLEMLEAEKPTYLAIAFDRPEPTFRHEADDSYKAGRQETPEDFIPDLLNLQDLLQAMQLPIVTAVGFEADDVIGTLAVQAHEQGYRVKILSGDRDLFQLVDPDDRITVLYLSGAYGKANAAGHNASEFTTEAVRQKLGIPPSLVVDYKALCGDASDNIPGVRGVGEKTAVNLLTTYGSLQGVYESLDKMKGAIKQKLADGRESAFHSQFMARIKTDVPLAIDVAACQLQGFEATALEPWLARLEFRDRSLRKKLDRLATGSWETPVEQAAEAPAETAPVQPIQEVGEEDTWFFSAAETTLAQAGPPQTLPIPPTVIDTPEKLAELVTQLQACTDPSQPVAWDTETTALDPRDAELVGIGCCFPAQDADAPHPVVVAYLPLGHHKGTTLDKAAVLAALRPILEGADYPKVLQNAKFDRLIFLAQGIHLAGVVFDTMLASYVLNPDGSHNLTDLGFRYLNLQATSYSDLVPKGKTIADISIPQVADYCGMDVYTTFHLLPLLRSQLMAIPTLHTLLTDIELPLEPVLADMEYTGIRIDRAYLQEFSRNLEQDLAAIEKQAYASAGEEFNLGSPKQLSELLFEKLSLDRRKSRKIKTGYSTDATVLEKLQGDHPVIDAILEHRTLSKLKSTYVDALPELVRPDTGRVHTDFNQAVTATGRLSSSNPNLQNIPIRTAFSRQIRKAFVPEPGWVLVAADYSQIELRILAHLSQEPILLETYRNNQDVHSLTARMLFEKEDITPDERRLGKVINFGVIYGMGAQRFAREANVSATEAKTFIDRFNDRYPLVFAYLLQKQREAIAQGYVETIRGRRRYFNFTTDSLQRLRGQDPTTIDLTKLKLRDQYEAQSLRAAANAPIQGSSADIIKLAMVKIHDLLQPYQARLLLQVHDELVFEMPPEEWKELQTPIKTAMESAVSLSIPLVVDIHAGQNWMETK